MDARFDRAIMGKGRVLSAVVARVENDGRVIQRLHLTGQTAPNANFHLGIAPDRGGRKLTGSADDAGGLFRVFDVIDSMEGGKLTVAGSL